MIDTPPQEQKVVAPDVAPEEKEAPQTLQDLYELYGLQPNPKQNSASEEIDAEQTSEPYGFENAKKIELRPRSFSHKTFRHVSASHSYKGASEIHHSESSMPSHGTKSAQATIDDYKTRMFAIATNPSNNSLSQFIELHEYYTNGVYAEDKKGIVYAGKGTPEQIQKLNENMEKRAINLLNNTDSLSKSDIEVFDSFVALLPEGNVWEQRIKKELATVKPYLISRAENKATAKEQSEQKSEAKAEKKGWLKRLFGKDDSKKEVAETVKTEAKAETKAEVKPEKKSWLSRLFSKKEKVVAVDTEFKNLDIPKAEVSQVIAEQPYEFNSEPEKNRESIYEWCEKFGGKGNKNVKQEDWDKLPSEFHRAARFANDWYSSVKDKHSKDFSWDEFKNKGFAKELGQAKEKYDAWFKRGKSGPRTLIEKRNALQAAQSLYGKRKTSMR